jgi:hypothetical protein
MKIPFVDDLFRSTIKSDISNEYQQSSAIEGATGNFLEKVKKDLLPDIPSFDNIKELSSAALSSLATSIGIDKNTFTKIMDIADTLNLSSLIDGDVNAVKTALLEQLELKNLVKHALNPDVLKMLAESVGISEKNLENMLKTSYQIKTFSDIKNMEIYEKLDTVFKNKLIKDNFLSDPIKTTDPAGNIETESETLLKTVVYVSTLLYSKDEDDRKKAEDEAKKLQPQFLILFTPSDPEPDIDQRPGSRVTTPSPWIENFSKIDYRVQKVAALAMGFGSEEDAVLQLRDTIQLINEYKKIDDEVQQKKGGLQDHLFELDNTTIQNKNAINDYKEEHGLSDNQFDNACKICFSDEMYPKKDEDTMCTDDVPPDFDNQFDEDDPSWILGLDSKLVTRDETTNEIVAYNGDIILTGNKDKITGKSFTDQIPLKIPKIYGNFICKDMKLKNLTNAPDFVQGNFDCSLNELTSLAGAPKQVGGNFNASYNFLQTIEGLPTSVGGNIDLKNNDLENLDISYPVTLVNNGDFIVSDNFLANLQSGDITGIGTLDVSDNKLRNTTLVENCLLRIKKGIIATDQISGIVDIKTLRDKFGSDLRYEV